MKMHELDLSEGKVYSTNYYYKLINWKVSYCGNLISQDELECCITNLFDLKELLKIEFTEVIEPVDFITAYNDCKENGQFYRDERKKLMYRNNGDVHIETNMGKDSMLSQKWYKFE